MKLRLSEILMTTGDEPADGSKMSSYATRVPVVGVLLLTVILSIMALAKMSPQSFARETDLSTASGTIPLPETVRDGGEASFDAFASQMLVEALPDDKESEWVTPAEGFDDVPGSMMLQAESIRSEMPDASAASARTYDMMLPHARAIALGEEHATEISFSSSAILGPSNWRWDSTQLGIDLDTASEEEIIAALRAKLVSLGIFSGENALMTDCPQYFYWMDKSQGYGYSFAYGHDQVIGIHTAYVTNIILSFPVAPAYREDQFDLYTTREQISSQVLTAIDTATEIATQWRATVPLQRVREYMDAINDLTDYNTSAMEWDLDDIAANGSDPWQVIWVFDGDPSSTVVCEGYAKALKYLCDLSGRTDIECRTVSGYMNSQTSANRHMWNVIRMDDGKSYLVDPTNCDEDTSGHPYLLCLQSPTSLSSGWYSFATNSSTGTTRYLYDDQTTALHSADFLELSMTDYVAPSEPYLMSDAEVTLEYYTTQYKYDLIELSSGGFRREPKEQRPAVTVSYYGLELVEGTDYTVSYENNIHAGTATVNITAKSGGYCEGNTSASFTITRIPVTIKAHDVYTSYGASYPDSFRVTKTPDEPVSFVVHCAYPEGLPVGTYPNDAYSAQHPEAPAEAITFLNQTPIQGDYSVTYEPGRLVVTPLDVGLMTFDPIPDQEWTGSAIEPAVIGRYNGKIIDSSNLILSYEANTAVGVAEISVSGTGNCGASRTLTFNVVPKAVPMPTAPNPPLTYSGSEQIGVPASASGEYVLTGTYKATSVGTYHTVASLVDQNHVWEDGSRDPIDIEWSISPAEVSFSIEEIPNQPYVPEGVCPTPSVTSVPAGVPYTVSYEDNMTVTDSAKVIVTANSPNYVGTSEKTFSIVKGQIEVTVEIAIKEYLQDDPEFSSVVNGISPDAINIEYSRATGESVGTYAINATVTGYDANLYEEPICYPGILWIIPATAQITIGNIDDQTYTGQEIRPEPTVTTVPAGLAYEYSYVRNTDITNEALVTVTISDDEVNYTGQASKTFSILPCPVSIVPDSKEMNYGDPTPELTATVTGLPDGIDVGDGFSYSLWREPGSDVGSYPIHASYGSYPNLDVTVASANLTIHPKPVTFSIGAMGPYPYDGTEQQPVPGSISASDSEALQSCQYTWSGSRTNAGGTGVFKVTATGNYSGSETKTFTISKRPASIVANSMSLEYGHTSSPELTATVSGVVAGEELDYRLESTVTADSPIGSYPISVVLGDNPNYEIAVTNGTLRVVNTNVTFEIGEIDDQTFTGHEIKPEPTISPSVPGVPYRVEYLNNTNAGTATLRVISTGDDYAGIATKTFRILKANASIAIDDATQVYGTTTPDFHATVTGNLPASPFSYSLMSFGSNVGTYDIDAFLSNDDNYAVTVSKGTLTITPAPATLTVGQVPSGTYTGKEQTPVPEVTTAPSGIAYDLVYESNRNVGTATVKAVAKGNYSGEGQTTFQITKAPASIVANDKQKTAFSTDPILTATVTGVLGGDSLHYSLTRESGETPGTYAILVTPGDNPNYEVSTTNGTFTISSLSFSDVYSWTSHSEDILWLANSGISTGWTVNGRREFRPAEQIVRADMAAFLFRLAVRSGLVRSDWTPSATVQRRFRDVNSNTSHAREIWWLASSGISEGWKVGGVYEFRPYAPIIRQDMAAFLFRLAVRQGKASSSWTPRSYQKARFYDVTEQTSHAREIWWLADTGVSTGWRQGSGYVFHGESTVLRQDMAAFLHRIDGLPVIW